MIAAVAPARRRCGHTGLGHTLRTVRYTNFALCAMYAHRLWIKLWISLGHPAENYSEPGGKAAVTELFRRPAHSATRRGTPVSHSCCARPRRSRPAQTLVIPGIHRPYDDYRLVMADRSMYK